MRNLQRIKRLPARFTFLPLPDSPSLRDGESEVSFSGGGGGGSVNLLQSGSLRSIRMIYVSPSITGHQRPTAAASVCSDDVSGFSQRQNKFLLFLCVATTLWDQTSPSPTNTNETSTTITTTRSPGNTETSVNVPIKFHLYFYCKFSFPLPECGTSGSEASGLRR